eukprot:3499887-Rhodomonas_salina.3
MPQISLDLTTTLSDFPAHPLEAIQRNEWVCKPSRTLLRPHLCRRGRAHCRRDCCISGLPVLAVVVCGIILRVRRGGTHVSSNL